MMLMEFQKTFFFFKKNMLVEEIGRLNDVIILKLLFN